MTNRLRFEGVQTGPIHGLSFELEPGVHWLLGGEAALAALLIDLCCGAASPKGGTITLGTAALSAQVANSVGALPVRVSLPHLPVAELVRCALQLKGIPTPGQDLLTRWGLQAWAARSTANLSEEEARTLMLVLVLANSKAKLLALYEPFAVGLPAPQLAEALERAAAAGTVVLIAAPSLTPHNTPQWGGASCFVLHHGKLVRPHEVHEVSAANPPSPARLLIHSLSSRALATHLSGDPRVATLKLDEHVAPGLLEVTGSDVAALAAAVGDAALASNAEISHISRNPTGALELSSTAALGLAAATGAGPTGGAP